MQIIAALASLGTATAGWAEVERAFVDWTEKANVSIHRTRGMLPGLDGFASRSAMVGQLSGLLQISEYGCWCYFDGKYEKGRGHTVDEFDKHCKHLHNNYACGAIDAALDGDDGCVPWEVEYDIFTFSTFDMDITSKCRERNGDSQCRLRTCIAEMSFVMNVMGLYSAGIYPNVTYQHYSDFAEIAQMHCHDPANPDHVPHFNANDPTMEDYDYSPTDAYYTNSDGEPVDYSEYESAFQGADPTAAAAEAATEGLTDMFSMFRGITDPNPAADSVPDSIASVGSSVAQKVLGFISAKGSRPETATRRQRPQTKPRGPDHRRFCCGDYPQRFPYNPKWGQRQCCGQKTFDAKHLQCCPSGKLHPLTKSCV